MATTAEFQRGMPVLESTGFGWIIADGARYEHDIIITVDGRILPRPKHLSKKHGGWHTVLGPEELDDVLSGGVEVLLIGRGQYGLLPIHAATRALISERGIKLETASTPRAIACLRQLAAEGRRVAAILHVTC